MPPMPMHGNGVKQKEPAARHADRITASQKLPWHFCDELERSHSVSARKRSMSLAALCVVVLDISSDCAGRETVSTKTHTHTHTHIFYVHMHMYLIYMYVYVCMNMYTYNVYLHTHTHIYIYKYVYNSTTCTHLPQ